MTGGVESRATREPPRVVGRYELHEPIAAGGMAAVYFGRLLGPVGFTRTVAIKRLHPQFAQDPEFVSMFLDEARLAGRIRHPNVVPTLDVVATNDELFLIMDYVQGEALGRLVRGAEAQFLRAPLPIVIAIFLNVLEGLHAAHEVADDAGHPLGIVHRDVSPQNVLVGVDGVSRVLDFGVAKARGRVHHTRSGVIKGKVAYMAPEQIQAETEITRAADIYSTSVCLWEALTGSRLYQADSEAALMHRVLHGTPASPRQLAPDVPEDVAQIVLRGLARDAGARFATAHDMARALASASHAATAMDVAEWVRSVAGDALSKRAAIIARIERDTAQSRFAEADAFVANLKSSPLVPVDLDDVQIPTKPELEGTSARSTSAVIAASQSGTLQAPEAQARTSRSWAMAAVAVLALAVGAVAAWLHFTGEPSPSTASAPPPAVTALAPAPDAPSTASAPTHASAAASTSAAPVATASGAPIAPTRSPKASPDRPLRSAPPPKPDKPNDGLFERN